MGRLHFPSLAHIRRRWTFLSLALCVTCSLWEDETSITTWTKQSIDLVFASGQMCNFTVLRNNLIQILMYGGYMYVHSNLANEKEVYVCTKVHSWITSFTEYLLCRHHVRKSTCRLLEHRTNLQAFSRIQSPVVCVCHCNYRPNRPKPNLSSHHPNFLHSTTVAHHWGWNRKLLLTRLIGHVQMARLLVGCPEDTSCFTPILRWKI